MRTISKAVLIVLATSLLPNLALAVAPEDYYNAGMDLMKQKDYEKAVQYFRAAVDQRPDYWQAYQFLGEAYYQSANRTEAVVAMRESLRLHPANPDLRKFMEKIEKTSPWTPQGRAGQYLPIVCLVLSLAALGWTAFLSIRLKSSRNHSSPKP